MYWYFLFCFPKRIRELNSSVALLLCWCWLPSQAQCVAVLRPGTLRPKAGDWRTWCFGAAALKSDSVPVVFVQLTGSDCGRSRWRFMFVFLVCVFDLTLLTKYIKILYMLCGKLRAWPWIKTISTKIASSWLACSHCTASLGCQTVWQQFYIVLYPVNFTKTQEGNCERNGSNL